jgi:hypothetical protein
MSATRSVAYAGGPAERSRRQNEVAGNTADRLTPAVPVGPLCLQWARLRPTCSSFAPKGRSMPTPKPSPTDILP